MRLTAGEFIGTWQKKRKPGAPAGELSPGARLTMKQAREIRALHAGGASGRSLAKQFNVSGGTISDVVNNKTYREAA